MHEPSAFQKHDVVSDVASLLSEASKSHGGTCCPASHVPAQTRFGLEAFFVLQGAQHFRSAYPKTYTVSRDKQRTP